MIYFKFVSFLLYPTDVKRLKWAMLWSLNCIHVHRLELPNILDWPMHGPNFL